MRQLSREQWQLIYSRLLHERHARRVTNEMLLRVQDTDTTKLGAPYIHNTFIPADHTQPSGLVSLLAHRIASDWLACKHWRAFS
jgi:hypothetical protein